MKHKSTLLLLMTTGMLLAACGGGNASSPSGSKPAGSSPTTSTPGSKTPSSPAPTSSSQPGGSSAQPGSSSQPGSSAQPGSSSQPGGSSAQPTSSAQPGDSSAQADSSDSTPTADTFSAILATGQVITLAKNEAFEPTDEIFAEYGGTASVTKNTVIKFQKNGTDLTAAAENGANAKAVEGGYAIHNDKANAGIYLKALSNGNYRFWIEGFETIYTVQIGDGDPLELTKDANAPEGTKAQYSVTSAFTKGAVLTFKAEGESISPTAKNTGNNAKVDDGVMTVLTTVDEAKLYLKLLNDDSYDVWLEGYQEPAPDTFAVTFGEGQAIALTKNEAFEPTDEISAEYKATATITKGAAIKFQKNDTDLTAAAEDGANAKAVEGGYAVHNDKADAGIYLKEYANGGYKFWIEGFETIYTVQIGDGDPLELTKDANVPEGAKAQYSVTTGFTQGAVLTFKAEAESIAPTAKNNGNNAKVVDGVMTVRTTAASETLYLKLLNDDTYDVWLGGYVAPLSEHYTIKIGDAEAVAMSVDEGTMPEGVKEQYTFKGNFAKDAVIAFSKDGAAIAPTASGNGNNAAVVNSVMKVLTAAENATLYLKLKTDDSYDVWLEGYVEPAKEYFVVGSMNDWTNKLPNYKLTLSDEKQDGKDKYHIQLTFAKDAELKIMDSADAWYPTGIGNNYVVQEAGDYDVFFVPDGNVQGWHGGYFSVTAVVPQV